MNNKNIFFFDAFTTQSTIYDKKALLGGKGLALSEMSNLGISVPLGFIITTEACKSFYNQEGNREKILSHDLKEEINKAIKALEKKTNKTFGCGKNPLIISVRSGAPVSMPGMMDTILNLGLNDDVLESLSALSGRKFALDSYRRFIQMYANVVMGLQFYVFEDVLDSVKKKKNIILDKDFSVSDLELIIKIFKDIVLKHTNKEFPQDVFTCLYQAIESVFNSWMSSRAIYYRKINNISESLGTAVNIQSMVFGNFNDLSGSGVLFTRNPSNGKNELFGEYLINAQGEDVVSGIRTPISISKMKDIMPEIYTNLETIAKKLEQYYCDMQDIEFTIEKSKLYILQTRSGKRTGVAAMNIALALVKEGLISKKDAILRINEKDLDGLLHASVDYKDSSLNIIAKGLPASPGSASGIAVFSTESMQKYAHEDSLILIRKDTSPEDIEGMNKSKGILTSHGGMTSHAAVVARGMGKPCVCGVTGISICDTGNFASLTTCAGIIIKEGEYITIDGTNGNIINGKVKTTSTNFNEKFYDFFSWLKNYQTIGIMANADTVNDVKTSMLFEAEGIGLCRTEHMFFANEKINKVRHMILADSLEDRLTVLESLKKMQITDFVNIISELHGKPITIRLLDPPLHEFLPMTKQAIKNLSSETGLDERYINMKVTSLFEKNPMLGHRGCRLGITYPEIYKMQIEAIFEAHVEIMKKDRNVAHVEIMIPLISKLEEFIFLKKIVVDVAKNFPDVKYLVGNMIELPAAAMIADKLALESDFFSFGTNDLTQTVLGLSRDDSGHFMNDYKRLGIFKDDPFCAIEQESVGQIMKIAIDKARKVKPHIKIGVCGEQAAHSKSLEFLIDLGIDYISCSPFRIPSAKLYVAHNKLTNNKNVCENKEN